ncbi:MAG: Txe/YoeB family addiction module toxin [Lentisphaerota bacterium]|jgi:toxin YoeB
MRNVKFSPNAWEDYVYWQYTDKKTVKRINELIKDCQRNPYEGIGKPEPLKGNLSGRWSRRINDSDRMVYQVDDLNLIFLSLRYHY